MPGLKEALASEAGQRFAAAVKTANVGKTQTVQSEVHGPLRGFPDGQQSTVLYLFSATAFKDVAALSNSHEGQEGKEMAAETRKPTDKEKLRKALAAELVAKRNAAPSKRKGLASSSSDSGDAACKSESAGSGSTTAALQLRERRLQGDPQEGEKSRRGRGAAEPTCTDSASPSA